MTNERYKEIRSNQQFLFIYFSEEGGKCNNPMEFSTMLAFWIQMMGIHPQQGMLTIVNFLDEKYQHKK